MRDYDVIMKSVLKHNHAFFIALLPFSGFILRGKLCFVTQDYKSSLPLRSKADSRQLNGKASQK